MLYHTLIAVGGSMLFLLGWVAVTQLNSSQKLRTTLETGPTLQTGGCASCGLVSDCAATAMPNNVPIPLTPALPETLTPGITPDRSTPHE